MAVSKIWPLYQTIGKAVKYICNYEKTNDGTLIDSYQCTERFADLEFKDTASKARKVKNSRIGYHLMISFSPEDNVTPEKALELGKEIVDQYTGGNYQYVLSVHTDQDHIHVHCIMNSVDLKEHKKFQIKDKDLNKLERVSDKVCIKNNLSVIEHKSGIKGRKKHEYEQHKDGNSWKDKLREAIDRNILAAESYEDFLNRMQFEEGYVITRNTDKCLSFKLASEGQERATRTRKLGDFYSVDSIKERIKNKAVYQQENQKSESKVKPDFINENNSKESSDLANESFSFDGTVKNIIHVGQNEKAKSSAAYRKKLNMINIETYAGMMNFTKKYHLIYEEDFNKVYQELEEKNNSLTNEIRKIYSELNSLEADTKQFEKYLSNAELHKRYITTTDKDVKFNVSDANKKYESALFYFKKNNINPAGVTVKKLQQQLAHIDKLHSKLEELKKSRTDIKNDMKQLNIIKKNNQEILGNDFRQNKNVVQNHNETIQHDTREKDK